MARKRGRSLWRARFHFALPKKAKSNAKKIAGQPLLNTPYPANFLLRQHGDVGDQCRTLGALIVVWYVPYLCDLFLVAALSVGALLVCLMAALAGVLWFEVYKNSTRGR